MKHVKRFGKLVRVCVSFASKEWHQKETSRCIEVNEKI